MSKTSGSIAAHKAIATRRANQREAQVQETLASLRALPMFTSPEKAYARSQVALFLAPFGGPVADMQGPRGESAMVLRDAGLHVIAAENGKSSIFKGLDRELLRAALPRIADGWEFYFGDITDVLPRCRTAFLDACGPLYVDSPSADLVRAAVGAKLEAFAVTVELSRVEGAGGGKERSAGYYVSLANAVLAEDAPAYKVRRVLRYRGEVNIPFAVFMLKRAACTVEGCDRRVSHTGLCQKHYDAQPERKAKRAAYVAEHADEFREYQRAYYPNWKMNPAIRADWLKYQRDYSREYYAKPENRERARELTRARRADPEYRRRERERDRETRRKRLAAVSGTAAEAVNG